ncbi:MAG: hypothetical protein MJZ64_00250 [Paludibacteraceae bacterium]|nr:hypothetical protein [Paludibacteraceae bacterium]
MSVINQVVTKWNKRFLSQKNLLPNKYGQPPVSTLATEDIAANMRLLESCNSMYKSLGNFRSDREINRKYYFGDQFCEMIDDPDSPYANAKISEKEYLIRQKMIPLSINLIKVNNRAIEGLFTEDKMDPLVKSRIREEQKIGEMMTTVMQYLYQSHNIYGTCARGYEEFLISALPCFRVGWDWDKERKENDVFVERCDINRMFWDNNMGTSEQYGCNLTTIGYLHDMTLSDVLVHFATSREDREKIEAVYSECNDKYPMQNESDLSKEPSGIMFYNPHEYYKCRVIEVWTNEAHDVLACFDPINGTTYTVPATSANEAEIEAINAKRVADVVAAGGDPSEAVLVQATYRVDYDWVVRYLTPTGFLLKKDIPHYLHGSHPFVIGGFPLVDGQVCSTVRDQRNAQRMINRTFIRSEYFAMTRHKGFKWVNKRILDRTGITLDELKRDYTAANSLTALDVKEGEERVVFGSPDNQTITDNGQVDMSKIEFFSAILDKVSGTPNAIRGEKPQAGTPSSLYAQQTQNANNNIADPLAWYYGLIEKLDYKMMMVVLQNYDKERYLRIVGNDFMETIDYVINNDQKDILCDVALIKSPSNGIARQATEDMLKYMYDKGDISAEEYLEATSTHGADKLLEKVKQRMAEQQEAQTQQAALAQQPMAQPAAAAPQPQIQ